MDQSTVISNILSISIWGVEASNMAQGDRPIRKIICGILVFFTVNPSLALVVVVIIQGLKAKRSRGPYVKKGTRARKIKTE
ncbi:hypothetical protein N0V84_007214 [Fusarium piperis]|uniref:Uncharacterized protein n=1 Tax=Fusarium piperis TaxID=1435070 RepID=A0A9W8WAE1_9HYPO|nr:hypothetical protein N0V84_007214 [Fusarium piperis]